MVILAKIESGLDMRCWIIFIFFVLAFQLMSQSLIIIFISFSCLKAEGTMTEAAIRTVTKALEV